MNFERKLSVIFIDRSVPVFWVRIENSPRTQWLEPLDSSNYLSHIFLSTPPTVCSWPSLWPGLATSTLSPSFWTWAVDRRSPGTSSTWWCLQVGGMYNWGVVGWGRVGGFLSSPLMASEIRKPEIRIPSPPKSNFDPFCPTPYQHFFHLNSCEILHSRRTLKGKGLFLAGPQGKLLPKSVRSISTPENWKIISKLPWQADDISGVTLPSWKVPHWGPCCFPLLSTTTVLSLYW